MSLSFGGVDASSRAPQAPCSNIVEFSKSRARRPAQGTAPPHKKLPIFGKTKWHWAKAPAPQKSCQLTALLCEGVFVVGVDGYGFDFDADIAW
jgi:hypothetical protein